MVVEDHYGGAIAGARRQAVGKVTSLHVREIPRSGTSAELLALMKIDGAAIVTAVETCCRAGTETPVAPAQQQADSLLLLLCSL